MNKYQEALENIKQHINETCYDDEIYETSICNLYPSEFAILQKLVDKETPKKFEMIDRDLIFHSTPQPIEYYLTIRCSCGKM